MRPRGMRATTDEELMAAAQRGDEGAFTRLVERWRVAVWRLCTRMTGDAHRGEELAQEAFARLFGARATYRSRARFSTYLWRIAVNLCHDERRRVERRKEEPVSPAAFDAAPSATGAGSEPIDRVMVAEEQAALVRSALARLPESHRAMVVLRHYEGLKFREIAEVLDIPEGTVKSRMAHSLTELARHLKPLMEKD